jgi:hypothetical protein
MGSDTISRAWNGPSGLFLIASIVLPFFGAAFDRVSVSVAGIPFALLFLSCQLDFMWSERNGK